MIKFKNYIRAILKFKKHAQLLNAYNTLENQHRLLVENFKNSAYKRVLDYENQQVEITELKDKIRKQQEIIKELKKETKERKNNYGR